MHTKARYEERKLAGVDHFCTSGIENISEETATSSWKDLKANFGKEFVVAEGGDCGSDWPSAKGW